ncbi:hypothetical protein ES703_119905 [subsurface metagenome]
MVSVNQFAIVFGMLLVYFVNYFIAKHGDNAWNTQSGWRWMFGSEALPAVLFMFLMLLVPESPRWLTKKGRKDNALAIMARVDGTEYARQEMVSIEETISHESGSLSQLFHPGMKLVLVIGVVLAVLQQVTGINVFLYFGSDIFGKLGGETIDAALLQQVVVGATNLIFTVIAICVVDKLGRKPLMIVGSAGMGICLFAMGMAGVYQAKGLWLLFRTFGRTDSLGDSVGDIPDKNSRQGHGYCDNMLVVGQYCGNTNLPDDGWKRIFD